MSIRTEKINKFDGVVRTLGSVEYVPKIKINLISLGWLDSMSYMYSITNRAIKITCGYLVLVKGEKCDGFYPLIKNIVINGIPLTLMES